MDDKRPVDSEPSSISDPPSLVDLPAGNGNQTYRSAETGLPTPDTGPVVYSGQQNIYLVNNPPTKSLAEAYMLGIPLGFLGLHHYYLHRPGFGVIYTLTLGLCGLGYVADWFRMPCLVRDCNKKLRSQSEGPPLKNLSDAYVLWFPIGGLLGLHHFYLRRYGWGVAYIFTLGFFGLGWLIDGCRMKRLVAKANEKILREYSGSTGANKEKQVCDAYVLSMPPMGLLGAHHYYLDRTSFGVLYTFTLGLCGVGWLFDLCRMSCLVKRVNNQKKFGDDGRKHLDDAYNLCFPFGFLGLHRFYLQQYGWGCLYLFTVGLLGIGWLIDMVRLPCMVKEYNNRLAEAQQLVQRIRQTEDQLGGQLPPVVVVGNNPSVPAGQILVVPIHGTTYIDPQTQRPYQYSMGAPSGYPAAPPAYDSLASPPARFSEPQPSSYPPCSQDPPAYTNTCAEHSQPSKRT